MKDKEDFEITEESSENFEPETFDGSSLCNDTSQVRKENNLPKQTPGYIQVSSKYRSSLIPDPEELKQYDEIVPGYAEKLLNAHVETYKDEAKHRRELNNRHMALNEKSLEIDEGNLRVWRELARSNSRRADFGSLSSLIVFAFLIAVGYLVTMSGHNTVGGVIFGTSITALAANFAQVLIRNKQAEKEIEVQEEKMLEDSANQSSEEIKILQESKRSHNEEN